MKRYFLLTTAIFFPAFAQTGAIPASLDYAKPAAVQAAPGQVVTLFLHGIAPAYGGTLRSAQASEGTKPSSLAGISVRITQGPDATWPAALFAVRQENECTQSTVADLTCILTSVRLQIPFDLVGDPIRNGQTGLFQLRPLAQLAVDVDGRPGREFPLQPVSDNSHILTPCDASWDTTGTAPCDRIVYRANGSVVAEKSPAKLGETVYVKAYGLGKTVPGVPTGFPAPAGVAVTEIVPGIPRLSIRIDTNTLSAVSSAQRLPSDLATSKLPAIPIDSAELIPGEVGTYKVTFTIPKSAEPVLPCGPEVKSNSLLLIGGSMGYYEGVGICVAQ